MTEEYEVSGRTEITVGGVTYPLSFYQRFVDGYMNGGV